MVKTLAPSVTHRDSKGRKFVSIVETAYDKASLSEEEAQRVNNTPGLNELVAGFIAEHRWTDKFKDEEAKSNYQYPPAYVGQKPIQEQVDLLAQLFSLSLGGTSEYIEQVLPTLTLPDGAEGWFAIPSVEAVAAVHFPRVKDPAERYSCAINLMLGKLAVSRNLHDYREGQLTADRLRRHTRAAQALEQISQQQPGDILIIPGQFGLRHQGRSVRRAREVYTVNEFGHGAFAIGCMLLTHSERLGTSEELWIDCGGDEFSPDADGVFECAPCFRFCVGRVEFDTRWCNYAFARYGSASGFSSQLALAS